MKRLTMALGVASTILAAAQAPANDWKDQPLAVKRQLVTEVIGCMKKRMSSDRRVSYNQAYKACREQVETRSEKPTEGPLVAADSPAK